jgi:dihydrofolate reductase
MIPPPPRIVLVAALAENRVIGRDGRLPWHLPADLRHFRQLTLDRPILMGRRTWESLPGPLPRRRHIVVTGNPEYRASGCQLVATPEAGVAAADAPEVMVVGGAALYQALLPQAWRMYLTLVHGQVPGDTFFPAWDPAEWRELSRERHPADARHEFAYSFIALERAVPPTRV